MGVKCCTVSVLRMCGSSYQGNSRDGSVRHPTLSSSSTEMLLRASCAQGYAPPGLLLAPAQQPEMTVADHESGKEAFLSYSRRAVCSGFQ